MTSQVVVPEISFRVNVESDETGWYVAEVPSLPGCVSQGRSRREAMANVREAIRAWLEAEQEARRRGWKPVWGRASRS